MIRHLVLLRFQKGTMTNSMIEEAKDHVKVMRERLDGIVDMQLHINAYEREGNFDMLLDCLFIAADNIEPYLISSAHRSFAACVGPYVTSKAVFDYEVPATTRSEEMELQS